MSLPDLPTDSEENDKQLDELVQLVNNTAMRLLEHVDTVQIFVTKHNPKGKDTSTTHYTYGDGNWFARYGQIQRWMIVQDKVIREE